MSRRHHTEEEHENHERWLLTYADLITLLLALFMMLYAMSVLDLRKYQAFQEAFTKGMGGHPTKASDIAPVTDSVVSVPSTSPQPQPVRALDQAQLRALMHKLNKELADAGLQDQVQLELQPRGLVMNVVSGELFSTGTATLTQNGQALLGALGTVFRTFSNQLVIEGHTDSRPISSPQFPSNWELSTARATAVLRYLITDSGIADDRMSAAGYADTRPRASNATEAGMAKNRRVDIVVLAAGLSPDTRVQPTATTLPSGLPTGMPTSSPSPQPTPSH